MKNLKKSILSLLLVFSIIFGAVSTTFAGSGKLSVLGLLEVPFSFYINEDKTVEETLPNQIIKESSSFDDKEKTRQAIVNAPSEGGSFNFNATFYMKQSTGFFGITLWSQLIKTSNEEVIKLPKDFEKSKTSSYIDLVVKVDEKITPAQTISAYFDSHTWRPTFIFDKSGNFLGDARSSFVSGKSIKNFTFDSKGETEYIIRVVPIGDTKFTVSQQDAPMKLGFDTGDKNFTISREVANAIAEKRRAMTKEQIETEKAILNKNDALTQDDINFLKQFNTYTYGNIKGKVKAEIGAEVNVDGKIPPSGIVATYENPKVTFYRNYDKNDTEKVGEDVFVEYNKAISLDELSDQSMPDEPTRENYKFLGWNTDRSASSGVSSESVSKETIKNDKVYYAIWKELEKQIVTHKFVSASGKVLPPEISNRVNGKDLIEQTVGTTVSPNNLIDLGILKDTENDGVWRFVSWKNATLEVVDSSENTDNANEFIGTWEFVQNKYPVKYEFVSEDNTELPDVVKSKLPTDNNTYPKNKTVNISEENKTFKSVSSNGGTWSFVRWDKDSLTVSNGENKFVGTWKFVEKQFDVKHIFESITEGKKLPSELSNRVKGKDIVGKKAGDTVTPDDTIVLTDFVDKENDGVWKFKGWDKTENDDTNLEVVDTDTQEVPDANVFIGRWEFTPNTYQISYGFDVVATGFEGGAKVSLPDEIVKKTPEDTTRYTKGKVLNISEENKTFDDFEDQVNGGVWKFKGWDVETLMVSNIDLENEFVGNWGFYKKAVLKFKFRSSTSSIDELPQKVIDLTPSDINVLYGDKVSEKVVQPLETKVPSSIETEDGKTVEGNWVFDGYENIVEDRTINSPVDEVVGKWRFVTNKYTVSYKFVSGTEGKNLPQDVEVKVLPNIEVEKYDTVTPTSNFVDVDVNGGTWKFVSWDEKSKEITQDTEFVGTWIFEEKPVVDENYNVTYEFVSGTEGKDLPQDILQLLPSKKVVQKGDLVKANPENFTNVALKDGTWTFEGWDNSEEVKIVKNTKFVGTWTFTKVDNPNPQPQKIYNVTYKFVSASEKELPQEVLNLKPLNEQVQENTNYSVMPKTFKNVDVTDGTWKFVNWNANEVVVNSDVEFVGTWLFEEKTVEPKEPAKEYTVRFEFISEDNNLKFPQEITKLLPNSKVVQENTKFVVEPKTFENVKVENGIWKFKTWDKESETIVKDTKFVGTWIFEKNNENTNIVENNNDTNNTNTNSNNNSNDSSVKVLPKTNISSTPILTSVVALVGAFVFRRKKY